MRQKNALEIYIEQFGFHPAKSMNLLAFNGLISDNCVVAADVADADIPGAIQFLAKFKKRNQKYEQDIK